MGLDNLPLCHCRRLSFFKCMSTLYPRRAAFGKRPDLLQSSMVVITREGGEQRAVRPARLRPPVRIRRSTGRRRSRTRIHHHPRHGRRHAVHRSRWQVCVDPGHGPQLMMVAWTSRNVCSIFNVGIFTTLSSYQRRCWIEFGLGGDFGRGCETELHILLITDSTSTFSTMRVHEQPFLPTPDTPQLAR